MYNYLLPFIYKPQFTSNIICKLHAIIYKSGIICKGCNSPYKQGPITMLHSYKYQVPSNPLHICSPLKLTLIQSHSSLCIHALIHIYLLISSNSYSYLSVRFIYFAGLPSYSLDKDIFQSRHVKSRSPLWPRLPWCVVVLDFVKNIWYPPWDRGKTYLTISCQLSLFLIHG